jgi:hypothetical protein
LIKTDNREVKEKIEKAFLKNRISYYIRWEKPGLLGRIFGGGKESCRICINESDKEAAREILEGIDKKLVSRSEGTAKKPASNKEEG